jgi:hypothetical protein
VFAGQSVGVTQVGERIWLVTFMHYDLGYFDDETCRLEPIENPFGPKVLPMCSEQTVTLVTGMNPHMDVNHVAAIVVVDAGAGERHHVRRSRRCRSSVAPCRHRHALFKHVIERSRCRCARVDPDLSPGHGYLALRGKDHRSRSS